MTRILGVALTTLILAACAGVQEQRQALDGHPIIGTWEMKVTQTCGENHTYRTDGTRSFTSGEEAGTSSFEISEANGSGVYTLVDKIENNNGKPDCTGHKTPTGDVATIYVKFSTTGNGMLVCYDQTMTKCFPMKRIRGI